jgi:hypothetical protein
MGALTLHAAADEVRALLDQVDPETGELPEGFEQARAIVATKATAVAAYLIESDRQADAVESYAKELQQRVRTARRRGEWLRGYLGSHMAACGVLRLKDERGVFEAVLSPGRDEAVDVFEPDLLPAEYMREIPAKHEPDKALIKRAIGDGFDVPGARIVKRDRLTIK